MLSVVGAVSEAPSVMSWCNEEMDGDWGGSCLKTRKGVKTLRRMRHLRPVVVSVCLVMVLASGSAAFFVHAAAGGIQLSPNPSSDLSAAIASPSGPLKIPWVATTSASTSSCFGGGSCDSAGDGLGTTCVISGFFETAGDFMYVAINYLAGNNLVTSVTDTVGDVFTSVGGVYENSQSVAFYDEPLDHGGFATVTVTISSAEYGSCQVGQLSAGTTVGTVEARNSVASGSSLSLTIDPSQVPSLLLALFGATRPTGAPTISAPGGTWTMEDEYTGSSSLGTAGFLYGYNASASGANTFTWVTGNGETPSISGIVVELYLVIPSDWLGYAGNAVYPTYDSSTTYLPAEQASGVDNGLSPVNNSLVLSLSNDTPSGQNYGLYYYWNSSAKAFDMIIPFVAVGGSNFTDLPIDGLEGGPVYEIGSMDGEIGLTGLGDPSESLSINNGNYLGLNTTVGNYSEYFPGGDDSWLAFAIGLGITAASVLFDSEALEIADLAYHGFEGLLEFEGAFEWQSSTIDETTVTHSTGVNPQISVWAATSGGSFNTNDCKLDGGTGMYTCGQNIFSEAFGAQVESPNAPVDATPGMLQVAATNQVWDGSPSWESPSVEAGASAGLSYLVEPGTGIGGDVTIFPNGPVAPGAQITLQQDCANAYSDFVETADSSGYWHFFANPGCIYSYWVNWDGYWYDYGASLSSSGTVSAAVTAVPGQDDESVNIDLGGSVVNFVESGLPTSSGWSVTLNGETEEQSSSIDSFVVGNGSYAFSVGAQTGYASSPSTGSLTLPLKTGYSLSVNITFAHAYSVSLNESGLPSDTAWSVILGGAEQTSYTSTMTFSEPSGTYSYSTVALAGYAATPDKGTVTVDGASPSGISISFSVRTYTVTFHDSGLPSGTSWSVTLGGTEQTTTSNTITFTEPNVTYDYTIGSVAGYAASPASGYVTVSGSNVTVAISFSVNTGIYTVTFTESGLPSGSSWFVIFNGVEHTSTSTEITFSEQGGTFSWSSGTSASAPSGFYWRATPNSGSMTVNGGESQGITFLDVRDP
jgi:hypothetical protein